MRTAGERHAGGNSGMRSGGLLRSARRTEMVLTNMINMQIMMFLLVITGFLVRKKEIIRETARREMVNFCLYVTLPFNIFHSFLMEWDWGMLRTFGEVLLLSAVYCCISIIASQMFFRKVCPQKKKPLRYGTIVSNGGFLGNPVIEGIYGANGLFYASVFMIPVRIVMWSVGTSCFMREKEQKLLRKVLTHPCIVAVYLGLAVMLSGIELPVSVGNMAAAISSCNTPMSMMLVGMMLAEMKPKGVIDRTMVLYTGVRLLLIPAAVFILTAFLPISGLIRGITVIIAGMPAPVTTALLSSKYRADEAYATGMIFITTILSLLTLPVWAALLEWL